MTNGWVDIGNTDMMLIMGGNPAENHPCGFKWAIEAKRKRNAQMIVVDPRFTRTAATADLYLQIRAGADIAFLGGIINRGTLCPKGSSLYHDILNDRRLLKPQVRRAGSDHWEDISWEQAIEEVGRHIKKTRDENFIATDSQGRRVNRCEAIAWNGGCTDTNEFNYLAVKTMRSFGVTYIENQARV